MRGTDRKAGGLLRGFVKEEPESIRPMLSRFFMRRFCGGIIAVSAKGKRDFGAGRRAGRGGGPFISARPSGSVPVSQKAVGGGTDDAPAGNRRSRGNSPALGSAVGARGSLLAGVQQERSMSFFSRLIIFFSSREI